MPPTLPVIPVTTYMIGLFPRLGAVAVPAVALPLSILQAQQPGRVRKEFDVLYIA